MSISFIGLVLLNLPYWSTADDIMSLATRYFDEDFPFKVKVKTGTQNRSNDDGNKKINPGYAFIEVPDAEALDIAIRRLKQADLQIEGRKIAVQMGKLAGPESETKKREKEQKEKEQQRSKKTFATESDSNQAKESTNAQQNENQVENSSTIKLTEESQSNTKEGVTGGKKPMKKKQNDRWICPACGYKSWARKTTCAKCDAPRPADAVIESNINKPAYSNTGNSNGNSKKTPPPPPSTSTESTSTTAPAKQALVPAPVAKHVDPVSLREFKVRCRRAERMTNNASDELVSFRQVAPRGLLNSSNTCFRNSVLQLLFAAKPFSDLLVELVRSFSSKQEIPPSLAAWSEILNITYALCVYGVKTVPATQRIQAIREQGKLPEHKPIDVTAAMPFICDSFKRITQHSVSLSEILSPKKKPDESSVSSTSFNESEEKELPPLKDVQEDAMEFVDFLLDILHEEELHNDDDEGGTQSKSLDDSMNEDEIEFELLDSSSLRATEEDEWEVVSKPGTKKVIDSKSKQQTSKEAAATMISRLFHYRVRSEFTNSNRKMTSITFQRLHCLSLHIANLNGNVKSLQELLAAYFSEEILEIVASPKEGNGKGFHNDRNGVKSGGKKKVSLDSVPPILMLQLKRFHYDKKKNTPIKITKKISYPIDLNLSEQYLSTELAEQVRSKFSDASGKVSPDIQEALLTYKLVGFIMHHGESANSGHYTTVYRDQDGIWWHCDDGRVSQIGQEKAMEFIDEVYILVYSNK